VTAKLETGLDMHHREAVAPWDHDFNPLGEGKVLWALVTVGDTKKGERTGKPWAKNCRADKETDNGRLFR